MLISYDPNAAPALYKKGRLRVNTKMMVYTGALTGMEIVLSRFLSINAWNLRIGFSFVPIAIAAVLFGPLAGGAVGALGDFIGAILFPTGTYFPGITLTAFLTGAVFGLFLHKKVTFARAVGSACVNIIILSFFVNTFWISILYGSPYVPLLLTRAVQCAVLLPVQIVLITLIGRTVKRDTKSAERTLFVPMTEEEAIRYIEKFTWSRTRLGLERTNELLAKLGDPQKELKFVHVAGSNGKGSICAMLAEILQKAGYRVGLYISPYVERFTERIQINGVDISGKDLAKITEKVRAAADAMEDHPSQFELLTAVGMEYFRKERADIVILEVGMGGELDSTNVIDAPEAAVIANIGLEHTEYLGSTLKEIASAKAGIIKKGCDCVLYDNVSEVTDVISEVCKKKNAALRITDFSSIKIKESTLNGQIFDWRGEEYRLSLLGTHQIKNACVALAAVDVLRKRGWNISESAVKESLANVKWPARMEILSREPLFILDGGHNPQCAEALADSLTMLLPKKRIVFLAGVLEDKDYPKIIDLLMPLAKEFVCLTPDSPRALPAEKFAEYLTFRGAKAETANDAKDGIIRALKKAKEDGCVIAFGSLYQAGAIRKAFASEFGRGSTDLTPQ